MGWLSDLLDRCRRPRRRASANSDEGLGADLLPSPDNSTQNESFGTRKPSIDETEHGGTHPQPQPPSCCDKTARAVTQFLSLKNAGVATVAIAMLPQGFLGGTLAVRIALDLGWGLPASITAGLATAIGAFYGKYYLVLFYNAGGREFEKFRFPATLFHDIDNPEFLERKKATPTKDLSEYEAPWRTNPLRILWGFSNYLLECASLHPKHMSALNGLIRFNALFFSLSFFGLVGVAFTNKFLANPGPDNKGTAEILDELGMLPWAAEHIFRSAQVALPFGFAAFIGNYSFGLPAVLGFAHGLMIEHIHAVSTHIRARFSDTASADETAEAVFRGMLLALCDKLKDDYERGNRFTPISIGGTQLSYDFAHQVSGQWGLAHGHCTTGNAGHDALFSALLTQFTAESKRLAPFAPLSFWQSIKNTVRWCPRTDAMTTSLADETALAHYFIARQSWGWGRRALMVSAWGAAMYMCAQGFNRPFSDLATPLITGIDWMFGGGGQGWFATHIPPALFAYPTVAGMMAMSYATGVPLVTKFILGLTCYDRGAFSVFTTWEKIGTGAFIAGVVTIGGTPVMEQAVNAASGLEITLDSGGASLLMETSGMLLALNVAKILALQKELGQAETVIIAAHEAAQVARQEANAAPQDGGKAEKATRLEAKVTKAEKRKIMLEKKLYRYYLTDILQKLAAGIGHRAIEAAYGDHPVFDIVSLDSARVGKEERRTLCTFFGRHIPNPLGFAKPGTTMQHGSGYVAIGDSAPRASAPSIPSVSTEQVQTFVAMLRR